MNDTKYLFLICSPNQWYGEGNEDNYKVNNILLNLKEEVWEKGIKGLKDIDIRMKGILKVSQDKRPKGLLKQKNIKKLDSGIYATFEVINYHKEGVKITIKIIDNFYKKGQIISKDDAKKILGKNVFDSRKQGYITKEKFDLITNYIKKDESHPKYKPEDKKPSKEETTKVYPRNEKYKQEALRLADFKCELDSNHKTFKTKYNTNYVEGHHLIPMSKYDDFKKSIDIVVNIVSLCPNCHRMLHFGMKDERNTALEHLFSIRKDGLNNSGLDIELEELKKIYEEEI